MSKTSRTSMKSRRMVKRKGAPRCPRDSTALILSGMKTAVRWSAVLALLLSAGPIAPAPPSAQRPDADMCAVPPGAQPLLPAKMLEGMGDTKMPVTTRSAEAQGFFNQGMAQVHSFWFVEAERSFLQAAALDPDMAMAY